MEWQSFFRTSTSSSRGFLVYLFGPKRTMCRLIQKEASKGHLLALLILPIARETQPRAERTHADLKERENSQRVNVGEECELLIRFIELSRHLHGTNTNHHHLSQATTEPILALEIVIVLIFQPLAKVSRVRVCWPIHSAPFCTPFKPVFEATRERFQPAVKSIFNYPNPSAFNPR